MPEENRLTFRVALGETVNQYSFSDKYIPWNTIPLNSKE